jgi:uncharacterized membrane protein YebE (DUF533 family)
MSSNWKEGLSVKVIGGLAAIGVATYVAYKMSKTPRNSPQSPLIERLNSPKREEKKTEEKA